jgi:hypothetical protein
MADDAQVLATGRSDTWLLTDASNRLILSVGDKNLRVLTGDDQYLVTLSVADASYTVGDDTWPWVIPFIATTLSLIGFWNMRRWGVYLFVALIALQLVFKSIGTFPISTASLCAQGFLLAVGLKYLRKMV